MKRLTYFSLLLMFLFGCSSSKELQHHMDIYVDEERVEVRCLTEGWAKVKASCPNSTKEVICKQWNLEAIPSWTLRVRNIRRQVGCKSFKLWMEVTQGDRVMISEFVYVE